MKKKILYAASTRSHLLHFHQPFLRALHEDGWAVHAAFGGPPDDVPWTERTVSLPLEKRMTSPANFRATALVRRLIRQEEYDAIIVHTSLAAFFIRLALFGLKKRPVVINMVHGYLFDQRTPPLKRMLLLGAERLTAPVTDLLLTMNAWDHETAVRYQLGHRILHVPGVGVDFSRLDCHRQSVRTQLRRQLNLSDDAFVLLYPAEFSARKSQHVLLRALALLPANFMLALPGSGTQLEACKELAASLGVAQQTIFPGYVTDMAPWYAAADCAVSASRSEGLPFNVMEAMYCALPMVASDVKGHCDLISHGENGLLYPYGDEHACAQQLLHLARQPELAHALALQAQTDVASYGLEQVFPQVMDAYRTVLPHANRFAEV